MVQQSEILGKGKVTLLYKISKQVGFTHSCSPMCKHQDACPTGFSVISLP